MHQQYQKYAMNKHVKKNQLKSMFVQNVKQNIVWSMQEIIIVNKKKKKIKQNK